MAIKFRSLEPECLLAEILKKKGLKITKDAGTEHQSELTRKEIQKIDRQYTIEILNAIAKIIEE